MSIETIKFSEFLDGGDLANDATTVGLSGGSNASFNNPWTFLASGTTAERPAIAASMYYRLRFNTTAPTTYEFYDPTAVAWIQVEDSGDIDDLTARLAAHTAGDGASMIGLEDQTGVTSKTVQDMAEATIVAQTDNGTLTNAQFLDDLATGFMSTTNLTGVVATRTLTETANQVDITNIDGSGNPAFSLSSTLDAPGTFTIQNSIDVNAIINDSSMATATASNLSTSTALKTYIDNVAGGGFTVILTCLLGTTANLSATYANGAAGVGATLTNNSTQVALTIDGVLTQVADRVLVKDQTAQEENGVYCLDEETEILTQDGFKHYTQVSKGDLVLTFNCETQKNEWQEACSINVFDVKDQEMLTMYGQKGHRSISTLNHRWPVKHRYSDKIRIVESKDLNHSHSILKAAELSQYPEEKTYDDEFVQLVAWFYTEDEVRKNNSGSMSTAVRISQSNTANPLYVSEIRDCLTHCFGEPTDVMRRERGGIWESEWREEDRTENYGMIVFSLNTKAGECLTKIAKGFDKIVSKEFLLSLTKKQLELFLKTSINADGYTRPSTGQITFAQKVRERAECFQYACILLGYSANMTISSEGMYTVFLGTTKKCQPHLSATHSKYTGKVWCPTTQNSTWVARKDGYVFITGNTVTTVGDGSTNWELTRATDYDEAAEIIPGTIVPVSSGTVTGGSLWLETATVTTVGTDPILFAIFGQPSGTYVTLATTQTVSGAKTFSNNVVFSGGSTLDLNGGTAVDNILDEDTMSSDSPTALATQQSIKAYVDAQISGSAANPSGTIIAFGGTSSPSGYLECDGTAVNRATYSDLFAAISTTWGAGNGTTTFNLPDLARSTVVGSGGTGTGELGNAVGDTGGAETHTLVTSEIPAHTHSLDDAISRTNSGLSGNIAGNPWSTITATGSTGGDGAHNNMQPSAVVFMCIKT